MWPAFWAISCWPIMLVATVAGWTGSAAATAGSVAVSVPVT